MRRRTQNIAKEQAILVDAKMRDYSRDPLIVKKVERARAFIAKHGLPKDKPKNGKSKKTL